MAFVVLVAPNRTDHSEWASTPAAVPRAASPPPPPPLGLLGERRDAKVPQPALVPRAEATISPAK